MICIISFGIGIFSLLISGLLTVVTYRLPLILQKLSNEEYLIPVFNRILPPSHCPECKHSLRFLESLPLVSYLFLKGKCNYCGRTISPRYPLIELFTLLCSIIVIYRFNLNLQMLAALILTWGLIALSGIDFEHGLLPDVLVFPLLWFGLILNAFHVFVSSFSAILGAAAAYLVLWIVAKSYRCLAKKEGMGHGDFKFFALLGAWLGFEALINILLVASLLGLLVACVLLLMGKISLHKPIPFGPYLAMAGWLSLILDAGY